MPTDPDAEPARDEHRARVERHMAGLKELAELGMELARALALKGMQQAAVGDDGAVEAERSFSRVTRAVRLTMALEARLSEGLLKLEEPRKNNGWDPAEFEGAALRFRQKLARLVEAAGEREAAEAEREELERRERGDRERLGETEGEDGEVLNGWGFVDASASSQRSAGSLHHATPQADASVGRSARGSPNRWRSDGSREEREPASHPPPSTGEELVPSRSASIIPPPSGEGDQPEAGGGGSPGAQAFPAGEQRDIRGP